MRDDTFKDNGDQFKASYMNQAANVVFSMRCRRNVCTQNNRARENTIDANFASEVCGCDFSHSTEIAFCSTRMTYALIVPPLHECF